MKVATRASRPGDFRWSCRALCAGALALGAGCNSLDPPKPDSTGSHLVIPTDTRPVSRASRLPPPLSGGTLLVTRVGSLAVASDSERDAIVIADVAHWQLLGTIPLEAGDEPGRLVEDDAGLVHVALRRGGAVVTIDPTTRSVLRRESVCGAPRGLAFSSATTLEVACADGKLVSLPVAGGAPTRVVSVDSDLRDVVVSPTGLSVSRFKSAELLRLDTSGKITRRDRLPAVLGTHSVVDRDQLRDNPGLDVSMGLPMRDAVDPFQSAIAWKTLAGPNGSTVVVHQRALDAEIELVPPSASGSAYGGAGFSCSGIVQNAVSVVGADGAVRSVSFSGSPLPVDATLLPNGSLLVAMAGPADTSAPRPFVEFDDSELGDARPTSGGAAFGMTTLSQIYLPEPPTGPAPPEGTVQDQPGCVGAQSIATTDPAVAVAYDPSNPARVVVQTVQPSTLVVHDMDSGTNNVISFDDGATLDTGFQLFHRDSGAGLACASCHAEGAEDGHVWDFSTVGKRRTQALHVGLAGTAPFHWDGELHSVGALMSEVFVGRMSGVKESDVRLDGLERWLFSIKAPAPLRAADDAAVQRGQALFRSSGCQTCHSGPKLTNNASVIVGTSSAVPLQVPSLIGVGYRAPFIHDGCAPTLADRFNPACGGGDAHGSTSSLGSAEIGDLVAYLESL